MEHRYYPREQVHLYADMISGDGKVYPVAVVDMSAIGMRVVMEQALPERIKSVDVHLHVPSSSEEADGILRMFVARKNAQELGLCLLNDSMRITLEKVLADTYSSGPARLYAVS
ncbi:MAG: hypothetical protein P8047_17540 [Gammaproteobacteria bacterium]